MTASDRRRILCELADLLASATLLRTAVAREAIPAIVDDDYEDLAQALGAVRSEVARMADTMTALENLCEPADPPSERDEAEARLEAQGFRV